MKPGAIIVIGLGLFIIFGLLAAGLSLSTTKSPFAVTTQVIEAMPAEPPADGSASVVYATSRTSSGLKILGVQVRQPDFAASVGFVPPPGCAPPQGVVLEDEGLCSGVALTGVVMGSGTTRSGHPLVIVQVAISSACHDVLREGDPWPSTHAACQEP
ncbi:MAG: hypothetical protein U0446_01770 [Dehalococcoidia bacterium]